MQHGLQQEWLNPSLPNVKPGTLVKIGYHKMMGSLSVHEEEPTKVDSLLESILTLRKYSL